jgi:hypothetical protein
MVNLGGMTTEGNGRQAILEAFDRLFDRAASKLQFDCSPEEKAEAKRHFVERYGDALQVLDQAEFPAFSETTMQGMENAIDAIPPAHVAEYLAVGPLTARVQEFMRQLAVRAAEQRLLEHLATQADETYGGN